MLKALAAMMLTAAHGAFINEKIEEETNDEIADDFEFLNNTNKAISIASD